MKKKSTHGGKRDGSGRKEKNTVNWNIYVQPKTRARGKAIAEKRNLTPGELIGELIAKIKP